MTLAAGSHIIALPNLKRTRRYGAKTRTGCITCKARRVKCDEARPYCSRCTSTGRRCDGYTQDQAQFKTITLSQISAFQYSIPVHSASGNGVRYLEFYHRCGASTLSGIFDTEFWSRIVMQMAQSEATIRHALIALGFLLKSEPGSLKHARSEAASEKQDKTLLLNYNKALRSLADRMAEPTYAPEVGFVACLLFICIEYVRGNYHAAFTHLSSGLRLLSQYQKKTRVLTYLRSASTPPSPPAQEDFAAASQSHGSSLLADKIVPIFIGAMGSGLLYGASLEEIVDISVPRPTSFRGQNFSSLWEVVIAGHELQNATVLFARNMAQKISVRQPITTKDLELQADFLECHRAWFDALDQFERERDLENKDAVEIHALRITSYATYTTACCATDDDAMQWDAHLDSFKAILYHAKRVVEAMGLLRTSDISDAASATMSPISNASMGSSSPASPTGTTETPPSSSASPRKPGANFTFQLFLIPILHYVLMRCRCPITRREIIALLDLDLPREALWDAEQHAAVARRILEIEEASVDERGWPKEETRLWCAVIDGNMDEKGGFLVTFAYVTWIRTEVSLRGLRIEDVKGLRGVQTKRDDAQWQEWFVLGSDRGAWSSRPVAVSLPRGRVDAASFVRFLDNKWGPT
ncbi:hypothetical protein BDV96DRAFT_694484 [Lophiotrema nucula]|uniref:Zn(2)-C6 fungal-type domain-containing protein n=1 Tax=Lophiotrema nucula TaxID=690887 RepID=A0A6A5YG15_9PLEO|nr:hypothetical protein BDV96DRAFT_694484 [Lophiotrema nucula]